MSKELLQANLIKLLLNYPNSKVEKENIKAISEFVGCEVGFDHDWVTICKKIAITEEFFPSSAKIVEVANQLGGIKSLRDQATECVDRYIAYLNGHLKHEEISAHDHSYYKKRFNCDKYAVQSGNVNLSFKRKEWIDICELDFETHKRTGELPIMLEAKESVFPGLQIKTFEGVI